MRPGWVVGLFVIIAIAAGFLFSFFQARTLPLGVYATDKDFAGYRLQDEALIERARLAIQRALPFVELMRQPQAATAEEVVAA